MPDYYKIVMIPQRLFLRRPKRIPLDVRFGTSLARESESNGCALPDLALNCGRAAMKIDNRFHQRESEAGPAGTARWVGPIEAVEDAWEMFVRDSGAGIADANLSAAAQIADCNLNTSVFRREAQRVVDQISDRAVEKNWIGENFRFTAATDFDMSIFSHCLVEADNFFNGSGCVKGRTGELLFGGFGAREEKKIIDVSEEALAFRRGHLDNCRILVRTALRLNRDLA